MPRRVIMRGVFLITILLLIGTIFFAFIERLSWVDAFYLAGTTLTTLGTSNVAPVTDAGKVFSIFYTLTGIGTVFYVLGKLFHILFTRTFLDPVFHERHQAYHKEFLKKKRRK